MGDHDLLERLVIAVENIAKSLEVNAVIRDFEGNIVEDVNKGRRESIKEAFAEVPNIVSTRETKENGTVIQEITEVKESVNYLDIYKLKHETEKAYIIANEQGLIKVIAKSLVKTTATNADGTLARIIVFDNKKWCLDEAWKEDAYR